MTRSHKETSKGDTRILFAKEKQLELIINSEILKYTNITNCYLGSSACLQIVLSLLINNAFLLFKS